MTRNEVEKIIARAREQNKRVDLVAADLRDADLKRANLVGANLRDADLRGADLIALENGIAIDEEEE